MRENQDQTQNTYKHLLRAVMTSLLFCIAVVMLYLRHKETLSCIVYTQKNNDKEKRQKHLLLWHNEEKLKFQVGVTINKWFLDSPLEILIQLRAKPVLNKTEIRLLNIIPQNKLKTTKCKKKRKGIFRKFKSWQPILPKRMLELFPQN